MTSSDNLVSIEQAAKYLGVHWQTVRRHIKTKKLPIVKIGRAIRIRQTDLETFVKGQVPHGHIHEIEIRFVTKNRRKIESNLIKMGAKLVTSAQDILDELQLGVVAEKSQARRVLADTKEEARVLEFLSHQPLHIDKLAKLTKLDTPVLSSCLVLMEMKGKVKDLGGMNYVIYK